MGPDLTDIGASRPLALIKEAILEPSKGLHMAGQEGITITLKGGKKIQGVARNRNNYSLQVLDREGNLYLISMLDVEQLVISTRSPIPEDFGRRLTTQEQLLQLSQCAFPITDRTAAELLDPVPCLITCAFRVGLPLRAKFRDDVAKSFER